MLEEPGQVRTALRLVQKGVPKEGRFGDVAESQAQGWRQHIFQRVPCRVWPPGSGAGFHAYGCMHV